MPYVDATVRSRQLVDAARVVMERDGVAKATMRSVAAQAQVPLGTLQYVFSSKEQLFRAVIEDVVVEIGDVLASNLPVGTGLEQSLRGGVTAFWTTLVSGHVALQVMQGELLNYALRTPGQEGLAQLQYQRYVVVLAEWCREAAEAAGEQCALPFDQLARLILAGIDGLTLQYVTDPDDDRALADLGLFVDLVVARAIPA